MALPLLLDDALVATESGFAVRVSLPWIRSMPLSSVTDVVVAIDGIPVPVSARLGDRDVPIDALVAETAWWFIQDRLELRGDRMLPPGPHDVSVAFRLMVPYLQAGPSGPLSLPFHAERPLGLGDPASAHRTVRAAPRATVLEGTDAGWEAADVDGWTVSASAFNWTPEVIRGESPAADIAIGVVEQRVAATIEIEAGQVWRSFPEPSDGDVDAFRERLAAVGGAVTIVGASLDDWATPARRRGAQERLAFLVPQLQAAARLGARGVRVPFGQAGPELLRFAQPVLHELEVVLYEEIQGQQTLDAPADAANLELLQALGDPRIRVLIDISMLMPTLPPSYLDELRRGGVDEDLVRRLETEWRDPETHQAVLAALREGRVPPAVHTLFMNLLVRFGRSDVADLEPLLPLTAGVHLKFWDLDDADGRVSQPISDIAAALRRTGFTGTLTSEWGGHEWLDADPTATTRAHLALAERALSGAGVAR
jgi:sugar phosphate isomerase/epimerase